MTYIFSNPRSAQFATEHMHKVRYVNIWSRPPYTVYHAGDRHFSRDAADKAVDRSTLVGNGFKVLYRVVVRFKPGRNGG